MDPRMDRQLLLQLAGELRATRYLFHTLIATLPDIEPMATRLAQQLPDLTDAIIDGPYPTSEPEREGWKKALAATSNVIAEIRRARAEE